MVLLASACGEEQSETPPRQIATSPFHYPEDLWDAEVEGETTLRLFVTVRGLVDSVQVERSSGYPAFDSAAVQGAADLRFEPARRGDDPVDTWILLPVRFEMPTDTMAAQPTEPETETADTLAQDTVPAEMPE
jgi:TonB family protein